MPPFHGNMEARSGHSSSPVQLGFPTCRQACLSCRQTSLDITVVTQVAKTWSIARDCVRYFFWVNPHELVQLACLRASVMSQYGPISMQGWTWALICFNSNPYLFLLNMIFGWNWTPSNPNCFRFTSKFCWWDPCLCWMNPIFCWLNHVI